ncbi:MAG: tripartite tricarboxylate transporter substrate binding protein [Burkholderiales bacterium]|nr:tripartite tricarboxylate transporter substrate binding protein [Burkholderiales bacterium]
MSIRWKHWLVLAAAGAALAAGPAIVAAQDWPTKPVRIIVPFPPGGTTDIIGREVGHRLSTAFGQPFVVENRAGASGNIGMELAARAPADGYTLVVGAPQTLTINPYLFKLPFNPRTDLAPIVIVASVPNILVVNPSLPVQSVQQLIDLAKKEPGKLAYGSSSVGGTPHLSAEMFKMMAGVDILHVPYKGSAPAISDLLGGQVQIMFDNMPAILPQVKAGKLRALAVTTPKRSPSVPELPTMIEAGVPGFESQGWFALLAPTGTPQPIIDKINREVNRMLQTDEFKAKLVALGAEPVGGSPADFAAHIQSESDRWGKVIKTAGIKAE